MDALINYKYVLNALVFAIAGIGIGTVSFIAIEILTPKFSIWKELVEKQNTAIAMFLSAIVIGIALIVAAAVHG